MITRTPKEVVATNLGTNAPNEVEMVLGEGRDGNFRNFSLYQLRVIILLMIPWKCQLECKF